MATQLQIKVDGDDVGAKQMLDVATATLKVLLAIERQMKSGKKPTIRWRVDMMSGSEYGLINLWATGEDSEKIQAELQDVHGVLKERMEAKR